MGERVKSGLLALAALALTAGLLVALDRLVLARFVPRSLPGFLFPPDTSVLHETSEFRYAVSTNALGFRDDQPGEARPATIAAIGDSFTFGWGVALEEAYPKVLERALRERGEEAHVANLGRPGASPPGYAQVARQLLPTLRPRLTLVGVLLGDDLAQLEDPSPRRRVKPPPGPGELLRRTLPHLSALVGRLLPARPLRETWSAEAASLIDGFDEAQDRRFATLDQDVRERFRSGDLNPQLVDLAIRRPDYFTGAFDPDSARGRALHRELVRHLVSIRGVARENGSEVLVIGIPYGIYVDPALLQSARRLGFETRPEMLSSSAPDDAVRRACEESALAYEGFLPEMRKAARSEPLYFLYDGHFNAAGHRRFGTLLVERMR